MYGNCILTATSFVLYSFNKETSLKAKLKVNNTIHEKHCKKMNNMSVAGEKQVTTCLI